MDIESPHVIVVEVSPVDRTPPINVPEPFNVLGKVVNYYEF